MTDPVVNPSVNSLVSFSSDSSKCAARTRLSTVWLKTRAIPVQMSLLAPVMMGALYERTRRVDSEVFDGLTVILAIQTTSTDFLI